MTCAAAHLYVEDSRLLPQLAELQVPSVAPVGRQEVEPVDLRRAARVVSESQVQLVHVRLGEGRRRGQRDSPQQQLTVARRLRDHEAQVGGGGVGVGEPQVVGGDGLGGAVLQAEARVAVQGGRDAVAVLDGEVEGAAAGRVAVGDDKTARTKLHLETRILINYGGPKLPKSKIIIHILFNNVTINT